MQAYGRGGWANDPNFLLVEDGEKFLDDCYIYVQFF